MKPYFFLIGSAALLALAGCNKTDENKVQTAEEVASETSGINIMPGEWQITQEILSTEVQGAPADAPWAKAMKGSTGSKNTVSQCITPEQVAASKGQALMNMQKELGCTYKNYHVTGGKITGQVSCAKMAGGNGSMDSTLEGFYEPDHYEIAQVTSIKGMMKGVTMVTKSKMTGKRLGDCKS